MTFIFDKLVPPLNICFKRCFKSLFSSFQYKQQSQKRQKRGIFFILHFAWLANGARSIAPPSRPPSYATEWNTFSPNSGGDLRSDAHQSQIIGGDADVDHTQIIVGDTVKL